MVIEHQVADILAWKFDPNPNPNPTVKIGLDVHVEFTLFLCIYIK